MKKKVSPKDNAFIHMKKGYRLLSEIPKTNRNIRLAIDHLNSSTEFFSKHKDPEAWGVIQESLGYAYYSLRPGNKVENIYKAVEHFMNIFTIEVQYRQIEIIQVYGYLARLGKRLFSLKNTSDAKTAKYKKNIQRIVNFLQKVDVSVISLSLIPVTKKKRELLKKIGRALSSKISKERWKVAFELTDLAKSDPELLWPLIVKYGSSEDEDVRDEIATCALEHLLEYHFSKFIDRIEVLIRTPNRNFRDTLGMCWVLGDAENLENARRLERVLKRKISKKR